MNNVGLKRGFLEFMDYREDYANIYEEEKEELLVKIKNGDNEARGKFIHGNLRLVLSVIQRFTRTWRKYR